jgi:xylulose-5-phosphate/fructose-6-phosphate phosphoketolase
MHQAMAATVEHCVRGDSNGAKRMPQDRRGAPAALAYDRSAFPKGMGRAVRGRRPQGRGLLAGTPGPLTEVKKNPEQLQTLEKWMHAQKPEELFDQNGKLIAELKELAPVGKRRMSANPHANGGILKKLCACRLSATTPSRLIGPAQSRSRTSLHWARS